MAKILGLNGLIHTKFSSESAMARAMNWSRQRLYKITSGEKIPNLFELDEMANVLGCSIMDIAVFYLHSRSTNVDK